ncbi:MAG TPA: CxxC-x17-CxxC domain-containing protein, partial [Candidatus Parcubacteria bacterium]|nr:CxxC-x17-CxxC domain-containing protein [Candidatus Parcubacteria bacterium]
MHQGDWTCTDCGGKITELPFQPSADRPIFCKECHSKR